MADSKSLRRRWNNVRRRFREIRMIAKGLTDRDHPILAHVIPMRRCNLSCTYCNEYDDFSKPAALETTIITISGGEPLMHPELDQIIARIRKRGMIAGMITNGYLLVADRIQ